MNYTTTHLDDTALAADYANRLSLAEQLLDTTAMTYCTHPTPANRSLLLLAARMVTGAMGDAALVAETERRTPTTRERH